MMEAVYLVVGFLAGFFVCLFYVVDLKTDLLKMNIALDRLTDAVKVALTLSEKKFP